MKNHIEKYLNLYAEKGPWKLTANSFDGMEHAVVIPSLAEYPTILETLHSLSQNSPAELKATLAVCVVNNRAFPQATEEEIANNRKTLSLLHALIQKKALEIGDLTQASWIDEIMKSEMRLAYVDASSPGLELRAKDGVGLARKIGMDLSLSVMEYKHKGRNLLLCLDADTVVEPNYLTEVNCHFSKKNKLAAVVQYGHRNSANKSIQKAIAYYESYLRYYVIGLNYARSPYAFHTIGSTIVSSAEGYVMVRGIPKRLAAEDFYFLNKLAKIQPMGFIEGTTVYPSSRLSSRTPFGTGNKITQLIDGEGELTLFYAPEIFNILGKWLRHVRRNLNEEGETVLTSAERIDPVLRAFLNELNFISIWDKLKKNHSRHENLWLQFNAWFDGLKTLKFIHYLTDHAYPKIPVSQAVAIMRSMISRNQPEKIFDDHATAMEILAHLKRMEKDIQKPLSTEISP